MKKNNDIQEWLRLYDTSVIPENKMNELISAGKKYMDSAEFNKNSLQKYFVKSITVFTFFFLDYTNRIDYYIYFGSLFIRLLECSSPLSFNSTCNHYSANRVGGGSRSF